MSVAARTPTRRIAVAAPALSVTIERTAASRSAAVAFPRLMAVAMIPVPSGLVRTKTSPGSPAELVTTSSGWTRPVTDIPNFGSGSSTV